MPTRTSGRHRAFGFSRTAVVAMAGVASLALGSPLRAQEQRPPAPVPLLLIVYDRVGLSASTLAEARRTAERLYQDVDVEMVWIEHGSPALKRLTADPDQEQLVLSRAVYVTLVTGRAAVVRPPAGVMGTAMLGTQFAWVFTPRVEALAEEYRASFGMLLGHVIAHEVGHLLLPASGHSARGLMGASLDPNRLDRKELCFDGDQGRLIRERLTSIRTSEHPFVPPSPPALARR
jgi:hypothetical protein